MGCAHRRQLAPAETELIQLLVAGHLTEQEGWSELTVHVLEVLQRNARTAGWQVPQAIKIVAVEILSGHKIPPGAGEKLVNISYEAVP